MIGRDWALLALLLAGPGSWGALLGVIGRDWALLALLGALGAWMALEKALSVIGRDWA